MDQEQTISVKDIKVANDYSICLSEEGEIYTWGVNLYGHLGSGEESTTKIIPTKININFKSEEKKLQKLKKSHRNMEEVEELLTLHSFVKNASKSGMNLAQQ